MKTIIDTTVEILQGLNLKTEKVATPPGYSGIQVDLPNDSQAFFVWTKMDDNDYHFRTARFWANENPFAMFVSTNLPDALAKTRVLLNL
jgi:hypothetical protein